MPIFMDRHIVPGIEAKHAAEAHREDLKIQDEYGCRCMTYWVDEERGSAFCLIDAPNEEAVRKMHNKAHGLMPHEILQVNSNIVEAFLGRIADPKDTSTLSENLKVFNDPAFRIILMAETSNVRLLQHDLGKDKANRLMTLYYEIMRNELANHEGREVELKGHNFVISFVSVSQALGCAAAVQKRMHVAGELINLRMGVNAGMPVEKSKELFGDTIKMAKYLGAFANQNQIVMASIIKEIYKDDGQKSLDDKNLFKWVDPKDENFIQLLMDFLSQNWMNPDLGVSDFCQELSMSKSKLYRKCTSLAEMSPNELIREYRLQKSLELLTTDRNITQTTFDCGFGSPSYFTKCFQQRFGLSPMSYLKNPE
ncbi:nickel-binding protein [uncultured Allomuricauda sp.]|uniref:nickel-binding protein n=1 Tax=Flagellimonas sp. W118 TaxID=3410791 RepID=UPI002637FF67|nr:nickel-binding protein [uncultured Allomuricauda sp.]